MLLVGASIGASDLRGYSLLLENTRKRGIWREEAASVLKTVKESIVAREWDPSNTFTPLSEPHQKECDFQVRVAVAPPRVLSHEVVDVLSRQPSIDVLPPPDIDLINELQNLLFSDKNLSKELKKLLREGSTSRDFRSELRVCESCYFTDTLPDPDMTVLRRLAEGAALSMAMSYAMDLCNNYQSFVSREGGIKDPLDTPFPMVGPVDQSIVTTEDNRIERRNYTNKTPPPSRVCGDELSDLLQRFEVFMSESTALARQHPDESIILTQFLKECNDMCKTLRRDLETARSLLIRVKDLILVSNKDSDSNSSVMTTPPAATYANMDTLADSVKSEPLLSVELRELNELREEILRVRAAVGLVTRVHRGFMNLGANPVQKEVWDQTNVNIKYFPRSKLDVVVRIYILYIIYYILYIISYSLCIHINIFIYVYLLMY
eukprot:GHVR01014397.1.p1 GENE.GHVR01014397.1~~GHVR01014397.1.p1  ORF type:complete len:502 (+),score=165.44 GHVR01014397.1:207-1508(+)